MGGNRFRSAVDTYCKSTDGIRLRCPLAEVLGDATLGGQSPCRLTGVFARSVGRELPADTPATRSGFVTDAETIDHEFGPIDDAARLAAVRGEQGV